MSRKMIINAVDPEEVRIAILDRGVLEELDIETRGTEKNKGNIYKAVVAAVEPALNAVFIDYGADKHGFLPGGEIDPKYGGKSGEEKFYRVTDLLKSRQEILVQIDTDEVGSKGAVLSTYLSLAGRYCVLMPGADRTGVSRKIEDDETRHRILEAASRLEVPEGNGVIIRTAGKDRTKAELNRDLKVLLRLWDNIQKRAKTSKAPALIFKEQDVVIRALRDYFTADIDEIVVDSDDAYDRAAEYMQLVMPKQKSLLTRYVERRPIFHHYRVEEQIETIYARKVTLPAGGSIVVEPTEALVSIDVNSGKQRAGGHEETVLKSNLEAAREVARQLRLRDLGGIIVIDFIDMAARKHQLQVERALKEALKDDKARIRLSHISPNGTLELTRQRIRSALHATMFRPCTACQGTGRVVNPESHAVAVLRRLRDRMARGDLLSAKVRVESEAANVLRTAKWAVIQEIEKSHGVRIDIVAEPGFLPGQDDFAFETNPHAEALPQPEPNFGPPPPAPGAEPEEGLREEVEHVDKRARRAPGVRERPARIETGSDELGLAEEEALQLGLPTFELVDPRAVGLRGRRREARREEQVEADLKSGPGEEARRRRGRRGGRRRHKAGEVAPGRIASTPPTVVATAEPARVEEKPRAKGIRGILGRLLGRKAPKVTEAGT